MLEAYPRSIAGDDDAVLATAINSHVGEGGGAYTAMKHDSPSTSAPEIVASASVTSVASATNRPNAEPATLMLVSSAEAGRSEEDLGFSLAIGTPLTLGVLRRLTSCGVVRLGVASDGEAAGPPRPESEVAEPCVVDQRPAAEEPDIRVHQRWWCRGPSVWVPGDKRRRLLSGAAHGQRPTKGHHAAEAGGVAGEPDSLAPSVTVNVAPSSTTTCSCTR